ncbi:MAG: YidC/Oxa1 family membrane protein insertase [Candidatus Paceibacteria bacterium]
MVAIFNTFIHDPIYNALAFLVDIIPSGDVGIAIILLTLAVKLILFPLSLKAVRTQAAMREIDPELKRIREEHKNNREESARQTMALLKEKKVNPLASVFLVLIQLPVIIGLYFVFFNGGNGINFSETLLYSFVPFPTDASFTFLGFIDLTGRSVSLSILVALTQFVNARIMQLPAPSGEAGTLSHDLGKSMQMQMKYVFPIVMGVIAYIISAAIALYFLVSNLFQLFQELYVKRTAAQASAQNTSS